MAFNLNRSGQQMSNLEKAEELLKQAQQTEAQYGDRDLGLEEYIIQTIKANLAATIGIKWEHGEVLVTAVYPSDTKLATFQNYNEDDYNDFCKTILKIDGSEEFNCSRSLVIEGVKSRVYAVMPPLSMQPNITISTTKVPPQTLNNCTVPDEMFDEIVHSNFIVVGASGSGKTYLMNYLLSKFIRANERIAMIEEFMELIPPNRLCTSLICPPPKPDKKSMLRFMTEQSNLMRMDALYVGEIKGAEAWPFVVNLASGTRGACTMHGYTAPQALSRLRALCQLETNNADAINEFIAKSINYIIVMNNKRIIDIERMMGIQTHNIFSMESVYTIDGGVTPPKKPGTPMQRVVR